MQRSCSVCYTMNKAYAEVRIKFRADWGEQKIYFSCLFDEICDISFLYFSFLATRSNILQDVYWPSNVWATHTIRMDSSVRKERKISMTSSNWINFVTLSQNKNKWIDLFKWISLQIKLKPFKFSCSICLFRYILSILHWKHPLLITEHGIFRTYFVKLESIEIIILVSKM